VVLGVGTILTFAQGARGQVAYEVLHAFNREGSNPTTPLLQASDGNFYGTTTGGGATGGGTVFKITAAGTLTLRRGPPTHPDQERHRRRSDATEVGQRTRSR
jgi:uncharacterized repeat protein (TIGR03803 family)